MNCEHGVGAGMSRPESGRVPSPRNHTVLDELAELRAVEQVVALRGTRRRHVAVVLEARAAARLSPLGLDQDHAVRGAAAVNRRRRRVLEHRDRGDVARVEQVQWVTGEHRVTEQPQRLRLGGLVVDRHTIDHVERVVGRTAHADGAAAADQDPSPRAGLAAVLNDVDARRPALDHLVGVDRHALVGRVGVDRGYRTRDGLPALRTIPRHHHRLENRGRRDQGELHAARPARRDGHRLELGTVPDPGRAQPLRSRVHAGQPERAVVLAEVSKRRAGDGHFDVGEGLLGRLVDDFSRDDARRILRAEWHRQEQTSDQCESEVTDKCHTSMSSTDGSEVPPSRDFCPYPSPEPPVVKDPHFASYPA